MEVQYLNALREVDSQTIALEFDRRELRRRRQLIAEKDRVLSKRRRRLERIQEKMADRDDVFVRDMQHEVETLQTQLKVTLRELRKFKKADNSESTKSVFDLQDQTYQLSYLKDKEQQLKTQIQALEATRRGEMEKSPSMPVSVLRTSLEFSSVSSAVFTVSIA